MSTDRNDIDIDFGVRDVDDERMNQPGMVTEQAPALPDDDAVVLNDLDGDELGVEKFHGEPVPPTAFEGDEMGVERFGG